MNCTRLADLGMDRRARLFHYESAAMTGDKAARNNLGRVEYEAFDNCSISRGL